MNQLQAIVPIVLQHDMLLVMGNMNTKVGSDNTDRERGQWVFKVVEL